MTADRLTKQLGIALEAIEAIADGGGTATVIAQQTLDEITRVGMEAIALEREEAPEPTEPAGVAGLADELERLLARSTSGLTNQYSDAHIGKWLRAKAPAILAALSRTPPLLEVAKEALESIRLYANDTLSGRVGGPADAAWYREGIVEVRNRARAAIQAIKGAEQ